MDRGTEPLNEFLLVTTAVGDARVVEMKIGKIILYIQLIKLIEFTIACQMLLVLMAQGILHLQAVIRGNAQELCDRVRMSFENEQEKRRGKARERRRRTQDCAVCLEVTSAQSPT